METDKTSDRTPSGAPDEAERLVEAARTDLQRGQMGDAEGKCLDALRQKPDHHEALYLLAVIQRFSKRPLESLANIARLIDADPGNGRAYQECGHCLRALGRNDDALAAFQDAVAYNSGLLASWRVLADMHERAGRKEAAGFARHQCAYLESLPDELQAVIRLMQENRLRKAENLCRAYLQQHGHHTEAMRLLAEIGTKFNSYDEAEFLLESCIVLEPGNTNAHFDYVNVLHKRQKFGDALEQAQVLRRKAPGKPEFDLLYANQSLAVGEFDEAVGIYRTQLGEMPNNPTLHLSIGHALKTVGKQAEAIDAYRGAYRVAPDFGDAYWSLANLKTYRFEEAEIERMQEHEAASATKLVDRYHLCCALGKALEDRGQYAESFDYYERGNRMKRNELGYDWTRIDQEMKLQIEHCTPALFAANQGSGCPAPDPIFIVGLPRAGSTLLEQILASHSMVEGTMELPNILALAHRIDGRRRVGEEARYPANLAELTADELTDFGEAYIRDTAIHRKLGTPYFIDKMPNNFRHIGLIRLILPNAKIIDARRDPMSCCFSGFKQLFAEGQEFTYGLEEIGHYYRGYVDLMAHWDEVLPGWVLRVDYEDVVGDLETQVRRILDHVGLPFEQACLDFHQSARAVRTPSSEQVRQPIFTSGLDQWQHYDPWLAPLRAALGPDAETHTP
jgi:tetratricopeptide (TPR) repeat protein